MFYQLKSCIGKAGGLHVLSFANILIARGSPCAYVEHQCRFVFDNFTFLHCTIALSTIATVPKTSMSEVIKVNCGIYEDMDLPERVNPLPLPVLSVNIRMNISEVASIWMSMDLPELGQEGLIVPPRSVKPLP